MPPPAPPLYQKEGINYARALWDLGVLADDLFLLSIHPDLSAGRLDDVGCLMSIFYSAFFGEAVQYQLHQIKSYFTPASAFPVTYLIAKA